MQPARHRPDLARADALRHGKRREQNRVLGPQAEKIARRSDHHLFRRLRFVTLDTADHHAVPAGGGAEEDKCQLCEVEPARPVAECKRDFAFFARENGRWAAQP